MAPTTPPRIRDNEWLSPEIAAYIAARTAQPDEVLVELQQTTRAATGRAAGMLVGADQGALLGLLTGLTDATFAVEVGTFTGYSSINIARALRPGGRMLCCDVSEDFTAWARDAWAKAGLTDVIELRIAPALDTLRSLPAEPHIDVAFIDADKHNYGAYWDELVPRVKTGGLLMADNTLWSGQVLDPTDDDEDTLALIAFNDQVAADARVASYILPIGDGLTIARKL